MAMIILGIDPGIADMGWGIIKLTANSKRQTASRTPRSSGATPAKRDKRKAVGRKLKYINHGVIKTPSDQPAAVRLWTIKKKVDALLTAYKVDEVAVERVVFNINRKTAIIVAKAHGAVLVAAGKHNVPVQEYNALKAKRLLTGDGRAEKKVVQLEIKKKLRLKKHPTPVHAADALAVALCHILSDSEKC